MEYIKQAPFIISTLSFMLAAATFWRASKWRDSEEVKGIESDIEDLKTRVAVVENTQKNVATKDDIKRLEGEVRSQEKLSKAQNDALLTAISGLSTQVASLNKFLLENR